MKAYTLTLARRITVVILLQSSVTCVAGAQWISDPTKNNAICTAPEVQKDPSICSDGNGGAIIAWEDGRDYSTNRWDIYAQRIDVAGNVQWTSDGIAICTEPLVQNDTRIISDGSGGAILAWNHTPGVPGRLTDIFAQKISSAGAVQWTANGLGVCTAADRQFRHELCSDGSGGAIVVWCDDRVQNHDLYCQKVSAAGVPQWGVDGITLATPSGGDFADIISDGNGGAIVAWMRGSSPSSVFVQRVDASGIIQWGANAIEIAPSSGSLGYPALCSDGSGGVIVAYEVGCGTSQTDVFAQRVDASGTVLWAAQGVTICDAAGWQSDPRIVSDGNGGAFITWPDRRTGDDIYGQHINAAGIAQWTSNGIPLGLGTGDQGRHAIIGDDAGGLIITWIDGPSDAVYTQRVDAAGSKKWTQNGVPVCTVSGNRGQAKLCTDGSHGAIITWQDERGADLDIYASKVDAAGQLVGTPVLPPDPPTNLTAAALSPTEIKRDWNDNAVSETGYVIEAQTGGNPWGVAANVPANTGSYVISGLLPQTDYSFRVKAVNTKYESAYSNVASAVTHPFPAPSNLQSDSLTFFSVLLHWQDNSITEDRFIIESSADGSTWGIVSSVSADSTSVRIGGLAPLVRYYFRVRAMQGTVASEPSNTIAVETHAFTAPGGLHAIAHSSEEIRLNWQDQTNGEEGFIIEFRELGDAWAIRDSVPINITEFLVGGLQPSTTYEFRLGAYTIQAVSPFSNIAQATTLQFLAAPTNLSGVLMSETHVALNWEDNASGETGYEIEHREGDGKWVTIHTAAANATMYDAQGLTPRTANRFRVRAVGDGAASGYSNIVAIETRMLPAAPLNLEASAIDHRTIRITWQRGSENEDGYEVERKVGSAKWSLLTTTGAGDGDILDENLAPRTTYLYRVRAENDQGYSQWSNVDSATTMDIPVPDVPFGLQARATGPASIQLSWIMPSPSTAEAFEIELSETGDPRSFRRIPPDADGSARTIVIDQLQPDTEFFFRIRAVNRSGPSGYSNTASARTLRSDYPSVPQNISARALSDTTIEISWEMPGITNEDGFEIQQSRTGNENDFTRLSPDPGQGARVYEDGGLLPSTTYYYRLRAYNAHGSSPWSDIVSATTMDVPISPELLAAMDEKQALIDELSGIIPDGSAQMTDLRSLLGENPRGFNEQAATALIHTWKTAGTDQPAQATEAMRRYIMFEEALRDSWGDSDAIPAIPGVQDIAQQAGRAPAIASKNLVALALAWDEERDFLGNEETYLTAGMEDVILSLSDNMSMLSSLMGSADAAEVHALTRDMVREQGAVQQLTAQLMLSLPDYWTERMLGRHFIPAADPLIGIFAQKSEQYDITGTKSEAEAKHDAVLASLRSEIDALGSGFGNYNNICYGLDAAYTISQTAGNPLDIFMLKLKAVRPRLVDGMHDAIAHASVPVERFLYLTSPTAVPGLGSLPAILRDAGNAIFDPVNGEPLAVSRWPLAETDSRGEIDLARGRIETDYTLNESISSDRDYLIELRGKVLDGNIDYIETNFDALRRSGQSMIAEVASLQRPLLGIAPADMYQQTDQRDDYYGVLARTQLLKSRRAVLSVALADYVLGPTARKQTDLVAEIDSIIGPLEGAVDDLGSMITDTGSLITLSALSLIDADIVRDAVSGPDRCRIRFTVKNVGGGVAGTTEATLGLLSTGVTAKSGNTFSFGALQPAASVRDSMQIDVTKGVTHLTLSALLETGGRSFIDRRTLPVPQSTTSVGDEFLHTASCVVHQNYPNPFNPSTTIRFSLPREMNVSLRITDALGREVWNAGRRRQYAAGRHSVIFDANGLPSGVYFYRLETPDAVLVRKMVLMR